MNPDKIKRPLTPELSQSNKKSKSLTQCSPGYIPTDDETKLDPCFKRIKVRPSFMTLFSKLAIDVSKRAEHDQDKIGCVFVNKNNQILSFGYNAGAKLIIKDGIKHNQDEDVHAEMNILAHMILNISDIKYVFVTRICCSECCKSLIQLRPSAIFYIYEPIENNYIPTHVVCHKAKVRLMQVNSILKVKFDLVGSEPPSNSRDMTIMLEDDNSFFGLVNIDDLMDYQKEIQKHLNYFNKITFRNQVMSIENKLIGIKSHIESWDMIRAQCEDLKQLVMMIGKSELSRILCDLHVYQNELIDSVRDVMKDYIE